MRSKLLSMIPKCPTLLVDSLPSLRASLVAQTVGVLPAMQETQVQCLGQEDPLEEGMATHSSILAWEVSWTEEFGRLPSMAHKRVRHDWAATTYVATSQPSALLILHILFSSLPEASVPWQFMFQFLICVFSPSSVWWIPLRQSYMIFSNVYRFFRQTSSEFESCQ